MSVLNKPISYFQSIKSTTQGVDVNLLELLNSNEHKAKILQLRNSDAAEQKALKEQLPCFTVAGTFSRRTNDGVIQLSGLAAIDLDGAEDYDVLHLLHELKKIDCIAYAGLSCRGERLYCIVPFKYPDKYVQHYERLVKSFIDMGLPMGDDCHKKISQPRYVSWNNSRTQFFNHTAKPYSLLPTTKTYVDIRQTNNHSMIGKAPDNPFGWCVEQINKSHSFAGGQRHNYMIHLARYCNIKGLPENETMNGSMQFIQEDFPMDEIHKIVKYIYTNQRDSHGKIPFKKR